MGGFGSGNWGGKSFGSNDITAPVPFAGPEDVTFSEDLTVVLPLKVIGVEPLSPFRLEVIFGQTLDPDFATNFDPGNYNISPTLGVTEVVLGPDPRTVWLTTEEQGLTTYTLTVATAQSLPGDALSPSDQTADFAGFYIAPAFFATAHGPRKVLLSFSASMDQGAAFTAPENYTVRDLQGNDISVESVSPTGPEPITKASLVLGEDLIPGGRYVVELSPEVQTETGLEMVPLTRLFQAVGRPAPRTVPISIAFSAFSGEVTGGLLGQPAGLLFFSPALNVSVPNSIIQVEEVSLCTRAFDAYEFPQSVDPSPLFTYSPKGPVSSLGAGMVLWAPAPRLGVARIDLTDQEEDTLPVPVSGPCDATLVESVDITKASFLNDVRWQLFPGTPFNFQTASNLTPIGPGGTTTINLES